MPHVNIKHFPKVLTNQEKTDLVAAVSSAIKISFGCEENVISIALEPIEEEDWHVKVYETEIKCRADMLCKVPSY